jgi:hypothetical protein
MKTQQTRWTAAYAGKLLDRADQAESDNAYAVSRGIHGQRISWWRKRLGRPRRAMAARAASAGVAFVEVRAKKPAPSTFIEVVLGNGRQVRVSDQVDPGVLARIADALEGRC